KCYEVYIMEQMAKVDKRTLNGNNGTSRGKDKKKRKRPTGYYVLKDEVRAGLTARMELVIDAFGGIAGTAKELGVSIQVVQQWRKRGMISADGAYLVHKSYRRNNCKGFRASFCRPDLRFDSNGKPVTRRCDRREMLRVVR
ncbi:hypothetical protein ACYCB3_26565, partial [Klebsiella pneumoniae]